MIKPRDRLRALAAIAGHALASNSILVTNNTREFARVNGLQIVDWSASAEPMARKAQTGE
jgi:predicted nucleic acid-binding protein